MAGARDEYGLTRKQRQFAEKIAEGLSQADAYRAAYDASEMKGDTIRSKASLLAQRDDVRAAVEAIGTARMRQISARGVGDRESVIGLLRRMAQDEGRPDAIRLRAVELWGRTCGAFVDIVDDRRDRPASAVASELEQRLSVLLAASAPRVNVIDLRPGYDDGDDDAGSRDTDGAGDAGDEGGGGG